jgi:hypothetical protein
MKEKMMSRMSELHIEISEMLENGYDAEDTASCLGVPLEWVLAAQKGLANMSEMQYNGGEPL